MSSHKFYDIASCSSSLLSGNSARCLAEAKRVRLDISLGNLFHSNRLIGILSRTPDVSWVFLDHAFLFDICDREKVALFVLLIVDIYHGKFHTCSFYLFVDEMGSLFLAFHIFLLWITFVAKIFQVLL